MSVPLYYIYILYSIQGISLLINHLNRNIITFFFLNLLFPLKPPLKRLSALLGCSRLLASCTYWGNSPQSLSCGLLPLQKQHRWLKSSHGERGCEYGVQPEIMMRAAFSPLGQNWADCCSNDTKGYFWSWLYFFIYLFIQSFIYLFLFFLIYFFVISPHVNIQCSGLLDCHRRLQSN